MNSTLLRTTALRSALRAAPKSSARAGVATTFVRGKATLPDLQCKCCFVFARDANH
jgi:Fe-Mn family superoxide dismutase